MKKAIFLTLSLLLACLCAFAFTGCKALEPVTVADFKAKAEAAEYTVTSDDTSAAAKKGTEYEIKFKVYDTIASAKADYEAETDAFPSSSVAHVTVNMPSHSYSKMTSGNKYYVAYRVGKTFLAVTADSEYKKEIDDFLKTLGY